MRTRLPALLGVLLWVTPVHAQTAAPVHATYEIYALGLPIAHLRAEFLISSHDYRIDLSYQTTGLVGALFRGWQSSNVQGVWNGERPAPLRFSGDGFWRGHERHVLIDYQGGAPIIRTLVPPNEEEREPVPPALQVGAIDTLSAMALLIRQVERTGRCETEVATYDGRRLADIVARTGGDETLRASRWSVYGGTALRCDFEGRLRAGFLHGQDAATAERPLLGSAWLGQAVPGGPPLPVQLSFETRWFGHATMYLTEAGTGNEAKR